MTGHDLMYRRQRLADGPLTRFWISVERTRVQRAWLTVIALSWAFWAGIALGVLS